MLNKSYDGQIAAIGTHCSDPKQRQMCGFTLFALALGSFCIGTSEFASMGILQLFSRSLQITIPQATNAITAYALGVVIGAPIVTLAAARLNRRTLLLLLMALFVVGNVLSGLSANLAMFAVARFISGLPQGAYFGAGAVVASYIMGPGRGGKAFALVMMGLTVATIVGSPLATFLGQTIGWRNTYLTVATASGVALAALWAWVPATKELDGGPIMQELGALRRFSVWAMMLVAALGVSSIFAIYTFVGPFVTDVAKIDSAWVPLALAIFGVGMTVGNYIGGKLADNFPARGLIVGFGVALIVLVVLATFGSNLVVMMFCLFGVGTTMFVAIPTIQVRMTTFAPDAPTLMGAMSLAAFNVSNAIGAAAAGFAVSAGFGFLAAGWAGFGLTLAGLAVFGLTLPRDQEVVTA
ncbi:MFS transporter [Rhizobium sp. AG207R]|uniref:MFS transporter n=1 Tax=Rhizobium sp. AG207R TaxID=2802287 RepID=UPI0022AC8123|nr:MFS transporter [Rhizobium sp. AG207R]MCZ3379047.1 MFS transporter [Rhizobium sp. AG207R]